jgi:hypothetical protein
LSTSDFDTLPKLPQILTDDDLVTLSLLTFWVFFDYFSNPTTRSEAALTFSSFPHGDFDHCDILSTPQ